VQVAAIGPGTERALRRRGVRADLVPERFVAESLLDAFPSGAGRVLLARAEVARDVLPEGLTEKGYTVEVLPVYRTVPAAVHPADLARMRDGSVDAITFTSSSTVTNFCDTIGSVPEPQAAKVISIGPITSQTARERGLTVDAEADPHTIDGLVEVLVQMLRR
jgi:uroporphyrinogen-III synthase